MRMEGVTRVEQRLEMVQAPKRFGLTVGEVCELYEVSRQTFYVWRRRYQQEGVAGLEDRSSRPHRSPGQIPPAMESLIVEMRQAHRRRGARRIRADLLRQGRAAPARSTVHEVLIRNGLIKPEAEPPPQPLQRFERAQPNELWQLDAMDWYLADGTKVHIFSCLDDHSRYLGATRAFGAESTEAAIAVFEEAAAELGLPYSTLADRGTVFTGRTTKTVVGFERHLWAYGVFTINGRGYHPQTQGKIERFHRTVQEWLIDHGPVATLAALHAVLAAFRVDYNHERPHQALDDRTPAEVWAATTPAAPDPQGTLERRSRESLRTVAANGNLAYGQWVIGLGRVWARTKVRLVDLGHTIEIRDPSGDLIREVKPDPDRHYLGTGQPRGRRPRKV